MANKHDEQLPEEAAQKNSELRGGPGAAAGAVKRGPKGGKRKGSSAESAEALSPKRIVKELDRYIVGQQKAKRAVAVALRNRWRRQHCPEEIRSEILPFNIILIGPTGVGKTEIARRLAALAQAPFIKVEASRFTEVGYVGRDVESMIRDLVELAVQHERVLEEERLAEEIGRAVEQRLLEALQRSFEGREEELVALPERLRRGELDGESVELEVVGGGSSAMMQIFTPGGMEEIAGNLQEFLGDMMPRQTQVRSMTVAEGRRRLREDESERQMDIDQVIDRALDKCEQLGIVFIDEIDKICSSGGEGGNGPDVSRQGVQKDILPVIEGTVVQTRYGPVHTDHMLFIASGAFHLSKPGDLIPELQGRFPVRVELDALGRREFERILTQPANALVRQYEALFASEGVRMEFSTDAVREVAEYAVTANRRAGNIGARRLQGLMHLLFEEELFELPKKGMEELKVDAKLVRERLASVVEDEDLSKYIL